MRNDFDTLIMTTPEDFLRVKVHLQRVVNNMPGRKIIFVGRAEVGELLSGIIPQIEGGDRLSFLDENDLLPLEDVHKYMAYYLRDILKEQEMPRKVTGWYYQQFLKLQYARLCKDEFYMTWDGDTVPCAPFNMFSEETGQPYLDLKRELHEEYFITMPRILPFLHKVIGRSFISEHLLFNKEIVNELIDEIEKYNNDGERPFWELIINAIGPERITKSAFSEFETYGTFVAMRHTNDYILRDWHSFRTAGDFFDPEKICDRDYEWLSKDFYAVSFEKWSSVREDHKNLFDNPEYQEKLPARVMLKIAQEEFKDGYIEQWG